MTDWLRRIPDRRRVRLCWWGFNLFACLALLAFALRG